MSINTENIYNLKDYKVMKLNKTSSGIWFYPPILTFSRMKWAPIVFKDVKQLFDKMELDKYTILFDVNKSLIKDLFNFVQKKYGYEFNLKFDSLSKYKNDFIIEEKINDKVIIIWNYKALKLLFKGKILAISKESLLSEFKEGETKIHFTGKKFEKI